MPCRIEAFNSAFREHMRSLDSITIDDLESAMNGGGSRYSREEIMLLLQVRLILLASIDLKGLRSRNVIILLVFRYLINWAAFTPCP